MGNSQGTPQQQAAAETPVDVSGSDSSPDQSTQQSSQRKSLPPLEVPAAPTTTDAPLTSERPDKLGRSSSRTAGLKNVHDPKGWEGWLRRWQAASRDVNGTSLLCLLVYALRSRARLLVGKVRTGIDHHKN